MKKLLWVSVCVVCVCSLATPAFPLSYEFDFNNDQVWDSSWTLMPPSGPNPGDSVALKVWLDDYVCPPNDQLFGLQLYFQYDFTKIQVNQANSFPNDNLHGGPFDSGLSACSPQEPGVYLLSAANFFFVTVNGNKILAGQIELQCINPGNLLIRAANDLGFGNYSDGYVSNCNLLQEFPTDAVATIVQPACEVNADCNDSNPCTTDACVSNMCENQPVPDGTSCDDGLYCNGANTCQSGVCTSGTPPCSDDSNPCTDDCVEAIDTCNACNAVNPADPCCEDPVCSNEEVCLVTINEFYVDGTNGNNLTGDGLTPATAWKTITHALTTIPTLITLNENNKAIVRVAASTYNTSMGGGDAETFPLVMKKYISLAGAGYADTIIDAQQTGTVFLFSTAEYIDDTVTIDGFTVTGGRNYMGGGFMILTASPTIKNCLITGNTAYDRFGGGIYMEYSNVTIANCIFTNNSAPLLRGGAISCHYFSNVSITNCTIVNNLAGSEVNQGGGGLSTGYTSTATITNCIFWDNEGDNPNPGDTSEIYAINPAGITATYSCIQEGYTGTGNTAADPNFFGTEYRLAFGSSAIDSGTSDDAPFTDIEGNARYDHFATPNTGAGSAPYYDMGAREYDGDTDGDGILDDGDESGGVGDTPCTGGATTGCDDSCTFIPNSGQEDQELDGIGDVCDNCPDTPNGLYLGSCVRVIGNLFVAAEFQGGICTDNGDCGVDQFCLLSQNDGNGNGIGDVCECYSDFNSDTKVDLKDLVIMKSEFLRSDCDTIPCLSDITGDDKVDLADLVIIKLEYLRINCTVLP